MNDEDIVIVEQDVSSTVSVTDDVVNIITVGAEQGPPGTTESYLHYQTSESAIWVINHNFGYTPIIQVTDLLGQIIEVEVVHISNNQARAYFVTPMSGYARCI